MAEDLKEAIKLIFQVIYIIIILYVAYQVIKALLGGTWESENIIIAGMGIILAGMFVITGFLINQGNCLGRLEERTKNMGDSLTNIGKDLKQHLMKTKI